MKILSIISLLLFLSNGWSQNEANAEENTIFPKNGKNAPFKLSIENYDAPDRTHEGHAFVMTEEVIIDPAELSDFASIDESDIFAERVPRNQFARRQNTQQNENLPEATYTQISQGLTPEEFNVRGFLRVVQDCGENDENCETGLQLSELSGNDIDEMCKCEPGKPCNACSIPTVWVEKFQKEKMNIPTNGNKPVDQNLEYVFSIKKNSDDELELLGFNIAPADDKLLDDATVQQ